ncbi:MAG: flagellar basal body rod protein FlgF [Limnohabitans sp.]|jgi:flagellar basal-body rod protein FlgF
MDRLIYTAMSGANAAIQRQSVLATNLANVSTPGFRSELSTYRSVPLEGEGASTRVFALETTAGYADTPGPAQSTGRPLDAMAKGGAWFAVQGLDGVEAYTRAGAMSLSTEGVLVNAQGLPMLDDSGAPLNVPANAQPSIGSDGTVTSKIAGQPAVVVGRLKLVTPDPEQRLTRGEDGLFRMAEGEPLPADATARMESGVLEGSNVNAVEAMVGMIHAARQFEMQMRLLQNAETNDKSAAHLLSMS